MTRLDRSLILATAAVAVLVIVVGWSSYQALDKMLWIGIVTILAISLGLVYGIGGMLSVAQATFASIGAYATAILVTDLGVSPWMGLPAAILLPAALAFALARVIVRLSPLSLAVATLILAEVATFAISSGGDLTGGFIGIPGIPSAPGLPTRREQAIAVWVVVIVCLVIVACIMRSQEGRILRVISTDRTLATSLGANAGARLAALFALGAGMAGTAGWFYAHTRSYLAPSSLSVLLSLEVLMMVIIGGNRYLLGPVLGAVLLTLLNDVLPGVEQRGLLYGLALVVVITVMPDGILGLLRNLVPTGFGRSRAGAATPDGVPDPQQVPPPAGALATREERTP